MKELFLKALLTYVEVLEIHIDTKIGNEPFHRKTWEFYEELFNIAHTIWERCVDLWEPLRWDNGNCVEQSNKLLEVLENLKKEIEVFDAPTKWVDNLLMNHLDSLENIIWSAKGFITKEKIETTIVVWTKWKEEKEDKETHEEQPQEDEGTFVDDVETSIAL